MKKSLKTNILAIRNIIKLQIITIIQVYIEVLYIAYIYILKYSTPKEITVICHNGSNYDYNFIMRKLAEEFEGEFPFLE